MAIDQSQASAAATSHIFSSLATYFLFYLIVGVGTLFFFCFVQSPMAAHVGTVLWCIGYHCVPLYLPLRHKQASSFSSPLHQQTTTPYLNFTIRIKSAFPSRFASYFRLQPTTIMAHSPPPRHGPKSVPSKSTAPIEYKKARESIHKAKAKR